MARSGTQTRKQTAAAYVRMSPALLAAVEEAANDEEVSVAAFLRDLARRHVVDVTGHDPSTDDDRRESPSRESLIPPADLQDVAGLAAKVSRLNGAVVQLTKNLREAGAEAIHADAEAILAELRTARRELGDLVDYLGRKVKKAKP